MGEAQEIRTRLTDALLSVLLAPSCAACDRLLDRPSRGPVCDPCWSSIEPITPPVCEGCGQPLPSWRVLTDAVGLCAWCRRVRSVITRTRAVGLYDGSLREIIHAFKYRGRVTIARRLAHLMRQRGAELLADADFVVPVPLHPRRRRTRGFNQAALLAKHLGPPVLAGLRRVRDTVSQTELPAGRRHRNVRDAFALQRHVSIVERWPFVSRRPSWESIQGRILVLVDDVATTGATLEACARPIKQAGAREVRALIAGRAVRPVRR